MTTIGGPGFGGYGACFPLGGKNKAKATGQAERPGSARPGAGSKPPSIARQVAQALRNLRGKQEPSSASVSSTPEFSLHGIKWKLDENGNLLRTSARGDIERFFPVNHPGVEYLELKQMPRGDPNGALLATWKRGEEYGVTRIDPPAGGLGFDGNHLGTVWQLGEQQPTSVVLNPNGDLLTISTSGEVRRRTGQHEGRTLATQSPGDETPPRLVDAGRLGTKLVVVDETGALHTMVGTSNFKLDPVPPTLWQAGGALVVDQGGVARGMMDIDPSTYALGPLPGTRDVKVVGPMEQTPQGLRVPVRHRQDGLRTLIIGNDGSIDMAAPRSLPAMPPVDGAALRSFADSLPHVAAPTLPAKIQELSQTQPYLAGRMELLNEALAKNLSARMQELRDTRCGRKDDKTRDLMRQVQGWLDSMAKTYFEAGLNAPASSLHRAAGIAESIVKNRDRTCKKVGGQDAGVVDVLASMRLMHLLQYTATRAAEGDGGKAFEQLLQACKSSLPELSPAVLLREPPPPPPPPPAEVKASTPQPRSPETPSASGASMPWRVAERVINWLGVGRLSSLPDGLAGLFGIKAPSAQKEEGERKAPSMAASGQMGATMFTQFFREPFSEPTPAGEQFLREEIKAMHALRPKAVAALRHPLNRGKDLVPVKNTGNDDCFLISLAQHMTGRYDDPSHTDLVKDLRQQVGHEGWIDPETEAFERAMKYANAWCKENGRPQLSLQLIRPENSARGAATQDFFDPSTEGPLTAARILFDGSHAEAVIERSEAESLGAWITA